MGQAAAKQGDKIVATDIHILMVPTPSGEVAVPAPHPFSGTLNNGLSSNVNIEGKAAATVGSEAQNMPPHIPSVVPGRFQINPTNKGQVMMGSATVFINNKPAARNGDTAQTCADPIPNPSAKVVVPMSTVLIG
jgi:uncharacterized Zn-binding protein involved in type VI secretion